MIQLLKFEKIKNCLFFLFKINKKSKPYALTLASRVVLSSSSNMAFNRNRKKKKLSNIFKLKTNSI